MSDDTADVEDDETYSAIRTVLGSTHRTARWHLTDEVVILTALGRSSFDLRLVETTGRPVAELSVLCLLGTVSLVVPPGTLVVLDGTSFLAKASSEVEPGDVSALPRIEVTATTVLGRVKIVSRDAAAAVQILNSTPELEPAAEAVDSGNAADDVVADDGAAADDVVADDDDAPDEWIVDDDVIEDSVETPLAS